MNCSICFLLQTYMHGSFQCCIELRGWVRGGGQYASSAYIYISLCPLRLWLHNYWSTFDLQGQPWKSLNFRKLKKSLNFLEKEWKVLKSSPEEAWPWLEDHLQRSQAEECLMFFFFLYCFIVLSCVCVVSWPYVIYFPTAMAWYSLFICAESAVKHQANKQINNIHNIYFVLLWHNIAYCAESAVKHVKQTNNVFVEITLS